MSRSSSSSLGSSVMRLNSLRAFGAHGMRKADGALDDLRATTLILVHAGAVLLHGEQIVLERGVRPLGRLRLGDRATELPHAPPPLEKFQTSAELLDTRRPVRQRRVFDHERG